MFLLRSAKLEDLDDLFKLGQLKNFINLPANKDIIENKIKRSEQSFKSPSSELWKNEYLFVLVDFKNRKEQKIIGCSSIRGQHGTEELPHIYLSVSKKHTFGHTLNIGLIHDTLKLGIETNGPTEIGGLILHPDYRKRSEKLGKQLSFVRFLFMGISPHLFKDTVHAELMPLLDQDGHSPLWKALGQHFIGMDYKKADFLSQYNKEFILSLFPRELIYQTLLPPEACHVIGKVDREALPVKRMLESIGFKYTNEVDPFDGGPHYRAPLKEIGPIRTFFSAQVDVDTDVVPPGSKELKKLLITLDTPETTSQGTFASAQVHGIILKGKRIIVSCRELNDLEIKEKFNTHAIIL